MAELRTQKFYQNIRQLIEQARHRTYRVVNAAMLHTYWNIGRLIVEEEQEGSAKAVYGKNLIPSLSRQLTQDFGKGFNTTNLKYMRQFYLSFPKGHAVRDELTWTHYRLLLKVQNDNARDFYIAEAIENQWSTRQLERQVNSFYYERLLSSQNKRPVVEEAEDNNRKLQPEDFIKDPYVWEFLNLEPHKSFLEKELETALISKLQAFLLELGKGFSFVARQQRLSTESKHFYIDLVFYNFYLKCFVLIDLKIGELTHQDIGQMDMYVRYYEDNRKVEGDNPTIGIILCSEKDEAIVRYSVLEESRQLFASRYLTYLPTEEELARELEREVEEIRLEKRLKGPQ
ncbi:MAG: DUF1016 domain-containing protein [Lewinellaceae bacterium]|nr:DUF1016 family protein [Phaeodactylibacter sp.]MCB9038742.1 DUF1016 domain-containing protein [Lewinellaceae bacterium]